MTISSADFSPLIQTAVYMAGILAGYVLLTTTEDLEQAWKTVREALGHRKE